MQRLFKRHIGLSDIKIYAVKIKLCQNHKSFDFKICFKIR